ncbi:MAG: 1-acyl-sn-glycerol-3-phosphate acyltransferase [Microscillaceae bacterium]|nr:1-acyl-sn-glycerol-3-phosphate acyltransferase [Microscillaceae bacterium]MDW8461350.1 lysophospholipid acyltransferase family protein [Cytophagales bacterium]
MSIIEKWWARFYFFFTGIYYHIEYRYRPEKGKKYIYCSNHTSLLDTITMGLIARPIFVFIGKAELLKIPIFGKIFGTFHIPVDRNSKINSYKALKQSELNLELGRSLVIFPEGGIFTRNPPNMTPFKDGAFRLAIEKKVPILPVTILHNWILLPDRSKHLLELRKKWKPFVKAIVHEPIDTQHLTLADVEILKQQTFDIINAELKKYFPERMKQNNPISA